MANYAVLKAAINAVIKTNGNKEITGQVLNQTLMAIVDSLGENYQFAGVAVPSTNPGTPDQNIFYLAAQAGTYTNFGATVLPAGISMLEWKNNTWSSETFFTIDDAPTAGSDHLVKSGGVKTAIDNVAFSTNEKVKDVGIDSTPTSGSDNLIKSGAVFDAFKKNGGVYDVTANNSGATFASLSALLNSDNLSTLIPVDVRHGGMEICFERSSDNKYVQARCMARNFTTNVTQWQSVDDEPTAGSDNLVKSGGVELQFQKVGQEVGYYKYREAFGYLRSDGTILPSTSTKCKTTELIPCEEGQVFVYIGRGSSAAVSWIFYNGTNIVSSGQYNGTTLVTIPSGVDSVQFSSYNDVPNEVIFNAYRISPDTLTSIFYNIREQVLGEPFDFKVNAYLALNGNFVTLSGYSTKYTNQILCKEGQKFIYTGNSNSNVAGWIFRNGSTIISTGQYVGTTVVTVPSGVDSVQFSSFGQGSTQNDVIFEVCDADSIIGSIIELNSSIIPQVTKNTEILSEVISQPIKFEEINGYLNTSGTIVNASGVYSKVSNKIPCSPEDVFRYIGSSGSSVAGCVFFNNNTVVSYWQYSGKGPDFAGTQYITIPNGVNYVRFSSYTEQSFDATIFNVVKIIAGSLEEKINVLEIDTYGFTVKDCGHYYMNSSGEFQSNSKGNCKITIRIPCKNGDKFVYTGRGQSSAVSWIFRNGSVIVSSGQYVGTTVVTIPSGVDNVQFSSYAEGEEAILKVFKDNTIGQKTDALYKGINGNVLYGKKWVACGDSFTCGDFHGLDDPTEYTFQDGLYKGKLKVYPYFIGNRNNMVIINDGIGGSIMSLSKAYIDDPDNVPISTRSPFSYQRYQQIPADADYITLWFGINDSHSTYLGTISDATNETFYGAWNVVLEYLITNHPSAKIGIIVTNGVDSQSYKQAVRDVALKWGIPYLDMTKDPQVPPIFERDPSLGYSSVAEQIRTAQFRVSETNSHPNALAHEFESYFIENWLRSL